MHAERTEEVRFENIFRSPSTGCSFCLSEHGATMPKKKKLFYRENFKDYENGTPCGRQFARNGRIIGGRSAKDGEIPWIVSVHHFPTRECGGSIISKKWIISAAHCFDNKTYAGMFNFSNSFVRVGSLYKNNLGKSIGIEKIYIHPNYDIPHRYSNDIALIKIKNDIVYDEYTWPICLDRNNATVNDKITTVAGWGNIKKDGLVLSDVLKLVRLPIVENQMCQKWFKDRKKRLIVEDNQICAGYKEGKKDACQGDSGGPQYIKEGNTHILVGIVSNGIGCAQPQLPGLYTRVSSYVSWIDKIMQDNS
ncbi:venom protease-like isoform X1 [Centruroides sculpturatus]|uniref:venom protease-like isoform X1 n=1 Tax=Centruroides sculpturatus TaxID=218467 RepID=UPI000C6EE2B1|nr:venom protease-like isoform X1 [Centruroides sculpturatus]